MRNQHRRRTGQVRNGAGHFQAAVNAAAGPAEAGGCCVQKPGGVVVQVALRVNALPLQRLVAAALAGQGQVPGRGSAQAHGRGGFTGRAVDQLVGGQCAHLNMQVNAVQQWPAELALVARHLVGRATAGPQAGAQVAAGAGVHRGDQLEARRELCPAGRAGNGDVAGLQRLAQGFECGPGKFG